MTYKCGHQSLHQGVYSQLIKLSAMELSRQEMKQHIMGKIKAMKAPRNATPQEQIECLVNQAQFYTNFLLTHLQNQEKNLDEDNATFTRLTEQPSYLKGGELKYYQLIGLNWLVSLYQSGISGILADDMGLGKTIQTISILAFLQEYKNISGPHLIIAPKVTLGNWIREFEKWLPTVRPFKLEATKEERQIGLEVIKSGNFDVIVTSYEGIRLAEKQIKKIKWHYIVIDEAHKLKNESSQISQKVRQLHNECKLLLTGTPLQNNLHELWSLMNFLIPQIFASAEPFDNWLASTEVQKKEQAEKKNVQMIGQLHKILKPFMLRRTKVQVEKSLPGKKEVHVFVGLSQIQLKIYRNLLQNRSAGDDDKRQYLNLLMQLRKVCCHPYLFPGIEQENAPLDERLVTASGKLIILDQLLSKLYKEGDHKVLLFSQMTSLLDILEDYCHLRSYNYCRIDGTTQLKLRESQIQEFNQTNEHFIFLLSTRAGGLGINLTAADTVILYDSDFNPQMDLQAMDRAYRIGQKRFVRVYRLITENTVEEKIIERQMIKLKWDRLVIQQQKTGQKNKTLTKEQMRQMLTHGANAIFKATQNTLSEELIDDLLNRGEAKTEAMNHEIQEKMRPPEDLANLNMNSINIFDFMQKNEEKKRQDAEALRQNQIKKEEVMSLDYLARRQRNKQNPKIKMVDMPNHHFYEQKERLRDLLQKQENYKNNPKTQGYFPLTQQEDNEKEILLKTGFRDWSKQDYVNFVSAWVQHGKSNIQKIANKVKKNQQEVNAYAEVFERRMNELADGPRIRKMMELAGDKEKDIKRKENLLKWKMNTFGGMLFDVQIYKKFGSKLFNIYADMALAQQAYIHGLRNMKEVKKALKVNSKTRYNFYVRSRTQSELKKRLNSIFKLLEKEREQFNIQNIDDQIGEEGNSEYEGEQLQPLEEDIDE